MLSRFKETYRKFSKDFWLLMFASFIDMLGGSLIFPFFSLFMTRKFNVGMTEVGTMFLVWALTSGLIGNVIGGALADRFGRKTNMIMGLIASAASALLMVVIKRYRLFLYRYWHCWDFSGHRRTCTASDDRRLGSRRTT